MDPFPFLVPSPILLSSITMEIYIACKHLTFWAILTFSTSLLDHQKTMGYWLNKSILGFFQSISAAFLLYVKFDWKEHVLCTFCCFCRSAQHYKLLSLNLSLAAFLKHSLIILKGILHQECTFCCLHLLIFSDGWKFWLYKSREASCQGFCACGPRSSLGGCVIFDASTPLQAPLFGV